MGDVFVRLCIWVEIIVGIYAMMVLLGYMQCWYCWGICNVGIVALVALGL